MCAPECIYVHQNLCMNLQTSEMGIRASGSRTTGCWELGAKPESSARAGSTLTEEL